MAYDPNPHHHRPRPHLNTHLERPKQPNPPQQQPLAFPTPWIPASSFNNTSYFPQTDISTPTVNTSFYNPNVAAYLSPTVPQTQQHQLRAVASATGLNRSISLSHPPSDPEAPLWQIPEPQLHRSVSAQPYRPFTPQLPPHQRYQNDNITPNTPDSGHITPVSADRSTPALSQPATISDEGLSKELSDMTLQSEEGLMKFQAGQLSVADDEWHRLVPPTAIEALGKEEVKRQSALFEIFKSEREYVSDLEAARDIYLEELKKSSAIPPERLNDFIQNVFWNLEEIYAIHAQLMASLFGRQRDQHPLVQSVSDIILENVLLFRSAYESYIKHYPLAEAEHRKEVKKNPKYQEFLAECMKNPRIKKRDLNTFITRPVTRLPRLKLLLEAVLKPTDENHEDATELPVILEILFDFIRSTQPGIEAAENKVKFWQLVESLVYKRGEIVDLDVYDESRTLVHSGTLARRRKSDTGLDWQQHGWQDYFVALLDNTLLLSREETRQGVLFRTVASRPIPLEFLRLGDFNGPSETRKEKMDEGGLFDSLRTQQRPVYPFTVYHAFAKSARRYTLYANSESIREKWRETLTNALGVYQVRQESNQWFVVDSLNDGAFRSRNSKMNSDLEMHLTGKVSSVTNFTSSQKQYLAIASAAGVYVSPRGSTQFRKVITFQNAIIAALHGYNKLVVLCNGALYAFSLDMIARASQGQVPSQSVESSMETIAPSGVVFFKVGVVSERMIVVYGHKDFRRTTIHAVEALNPNHVVTRGPPSGMLSFRSFGEASYVPKQAYDVMTMTRTIGVTTERGVIVIDPTNLSSASVLVVPEWKSSNDDSLATLKDLCEEGKPLGMIRINDQELIMIYEAFGFFITKKGFPTRGNKYIRWECKANSYTYRTPHVLLFSSEFIEIRNAATGRLVQVIEGGDIRLANSGYPPDSPVMVVMNGKIDDRSGQSEKIAELIETQEIQAVTPSVQTPSFIAATPTTPGASVNNSDLWSEWELG